MKNKTVVSERGTITIPECIRNLSGIHQGDLIEFSPQRNKIILQRLIVKRSDEENLMNGNEWEKFDELAQRQLKKSQYTSYDSLEKAKEHSRKLMRKKT